MAPDAVLASTNVTGAIVANLDDDPDSPDLDWAVATSNNVSTDVRTSFGTPTGPLTPGAGVQEFRVLVRKNTLSGTGTPTARIELWENGSLISASGETNVTSSVGQVISYTWNASGRTPSQIEAKVIGTASGGSPAVRASVDIGAVEWNADVSSSQTVIVGSLAPASTVNSPQVSHVVAPSALNAAATLPSPAVTIGQVVVVVGALAAPPTFSSPAVGQVVALAAFDAAATVPNQTVHRVTTGPMEVTLTNPATTPNVDTAHGVLVRALVSAGVGIFDLELRQGAAVLDSWTVTLGAGFTDFQRTFSEAVIANITSYTALRLWWQGFGTRSSEIDVSNAYLQFPEGTAAGTQTIEPGALSASAVLNGPQVSHVVQPGVLDATATPSSPQVVHAVQVGPLAVSVTIHQPAVTPGVVAIAVGALDASPVAYQPVVLHVVAVAALDGAAVVSGPPVVLGVQIAGLSAAAVLYQPSVMSGAASIAVAALAATASVYEASVNVGAVTVVVGTLTVTTTLHDPAILLIALLRLYLAGREPRTELAGREPTLELVTVGGAALEGRGPATLLEGFGPKSALSGREPTTTLSGEEPSE